MGRTTAGHGQGASFLGEGHLCCGLWPSPVHLGSGPPGGHWAVLCQSAGQAWLGLAAIGSLRLVPRQPNSDLLVFTVGKV